MNYALRGRRCKCIMLLLENINIANVCEQGCDECLDIYSISEHNTRITKWTLFSPDLRTDRDKLYLICFLEIDLGSWSTPPTSHIPDDV